MTIPAPPALLMACPGCLHNRLGKNSRLCPSCELRTPHANKQEVVAAWDAFRIAFASAALARQAVP